MVRAIGSIHKRVWRNGNEMLHVTHEGEAEAVWVDAARVPAALVEAFDARLEAKRNASPAQEPAPPRVAAKSLPGSMPDLREADAARIRALPRRAHTHLPNSQWGGGVAAPGKTLLPIYQNIWSKEGDAAAVAEYKERQVMAKLAPCSLFCTCVVTFAGLRIIGA